MVVLCPHVGDNSVSLPILPSAQSTIDDEDISTVVAPVLHIIPEVQELCVPCFTSVSEIYEGGLADGLELARAIRCDLCAHSPITGACSSAV